jgi:hypothetical protein
VVIRVAPPSTASVDDDSAEGPTAELGAVEPQDALTTATMTARKRREATDLGVFNDIGYS